MCPENTYDVNQAGKIILHAANPFPTGILKSKYHAFMTKRLSEMQLNCQRDSDQLLPKWRNIRVTPVKATRIRNFIGFLSYNFLSFMSYILNLNWANRLPPIS